MQSTPSKRSTVENKKKVEDMSTDEYTRWLCLLEAIELVSSKMNQYGHRLQNQDVDWIKSLAFQKYINERHETMKADLVDLDNDEEYNVTLTKPHKTRTCITLSAPASQ
jgi:hypothetical protein